MRDLAVGHLPWLPPAPAAFRDMLRQQTGRAKAGEGAALATVPGAALQALALHDLDIDRLVQLDRARQKCAARIDPGALSPLRLALVMQGTTDFAAPAIRASALRHGFLIETYAPDFGQSLREALSPASGLRAFGADIAIVAETPESLGLTRPRVDGAAAQAAVADAVATVTTLLDGLRGAGIATFVLQTLTVPTDPWGGHSDRRLPGSVRAQIEAFNAALVDLADRYAAALFDVDALAGLVGRMRWRDPGLWHRAKVPFALEFMPLYAEHLCHVLRALRGRASKCLVLDLDNTCWGGVIGDDGLDGIKIGQGSAEGEAFLAIQHHALALKERGVVLAVCSKNEEATAKLPFEQHPDMALRLEDIAVFVANWTDKATNLAHIAKVLNIGTDALVFLDDNPAERARVRQMLPEVAVPEVSKDPAWYPTALAQAGYFETITLSADDAKRAEQYRANAERTVALETMGDYDAYLRSLEMECTVSRFDDIGRARIAQLVNKSNQFNLTTRRYSEAEIAAIGSDPDCLGLQVRLTDRFGDNGMISVVIFRRAEIDGAAAWLCDTWLMSCRVLERRVEEAVLATVIRAARAAGIGRLYGDYLPSPKNAMVAEHFRKLGFAEAGTIGGKRVPLAPGYCG